MEAAAAAAAAEVERPSLHYLTKVSSSSCRRALSFRAYRMSSVCEKRETERSGINL